MALADQQVSVGSLVMGEGTPYDLIDFNPWSRQVRADQGGPRPWNHGAWSGAEFQAEAVVPFGVIVGGTSVAGWTSAHQQLAAAFAPSFDDVELRWMLDGATEYLMRGRPRMVEPNIDTIGLGYAVTRCAFVALDPLIYSGVEHSEALVLPTTSGGLTFPLTFPVTFPATVISGRATVVNAGTASVGLVLRIDGPVQEPRVSLLAGGVTKTLRFTLTLDSGQWLDVDTAARTVYLNGTASRRGQAYGDWPILPPGESEIAFDAAVYNASAQMSASWRDAYY